MPSWHPRVPNVRHLEPWQRDQYVVVLTVALAQVAFDLTQPFIPLYIRELGVTDISEAAVWAGIVAGVGPLCAAIMGPFWGSLADRYGRKAMVLRAMLLIAVMQIVSAFVPNVQWLLGARVIMGLFAGFTSMAMALAIAVSPRERMAQAIGLVQAAQLAPTAVGPTIGGIVSDTFGLRANFVMTGVILLIPACLLFFLVKEGGYGGSEKSSASSDTKQGSLWDLLTMPSFMAALFILFVARFTDRALPPILPLYLVELDTPEAQLATITGIVVASGAVAAAASSMVYGRRARADNTRRLLVIALGGGGIISLLLALAHGWPEVVVLRIILGLLAGGSMSLAYTMGARLAPPERSGLTLAVLASCAMMGGAVSPMLAGVIGQFDLRYVFVANTIVYLLAFTLAILPARGRLRTSEPAPAVEPEA